MIIPIKVIEIPITFAIDNSIIAPIADNVNFIDPLYPYDPKYIKESRPRVYSELSINDRIVL